MRRILVVILSLFLGAASSFASQINFLDTGTGVTPHVTGFSSFNFSTQAVANGTLLSFNGTYTCTSNIATGFVPTCIGGSSNNFIGSLGGGTAQPLNVLQCCAGPFGNFGTGRVLDTLNFSWQAAAVGFPANCSFDPKLPTFDCNVTVQVQLTGSLLIGIPGQNGNLGSLGFGAGYFEPANGTIDLQRFDGSLGNSLDVEITTSGSQPADNTPEPVSIVLLGSGLVGVVGTLRRKL